MSKLFKEIAKCGDRVAHAPGSAERRWTQVRVVFNSESDPGAIQAIYVPAHLVDRFVELLETELVEEKCSLCEKPATGELWLGTQDGTVPSCIDCAEKYAQGIELEIKAAGGLEAWRNKRSPEA